MMLRAFARFHARIPDYQLEVYGEGSAKAQVQKLIQELGLGEWVKLHPFAKDVHVQVRKASAFLLTSDYEGLSNAMLEAMAIGLPVIVTDWCWNS